VEHDRSVAVIGLGYVGLPLALAFVESGVAVTGIDASPARVEELTRGSSPIEDIPDARLAAALGAGFRVIAPDPHAVRAAGVEAAAQDQRPRRLARGVAL